ncbi:lanthionine synthetase LanC family protein [Longimicrobium sp.]|uniref:lanthionine synthetase LanC family protein n=1 Tax=Longimicrobium sp. TaxID=2029185 RepID=UPI002F947F1A
MDTQHRTDEPRTEALMAAAQAIGRRLVEGAQWTDGACTWQVMQPDRANPALRRAVATPATGTVYEGTAGIALYLAELHAVTGDADAARTALGAIRFALRHGASLPDTSFGYHSGRVGIAYAAARTGELLGCPEFHAQAEDLLRPLAGNESRDTGLDVIAGAGGAIPPLLQLTRYVDAELALGIARGLGDHLVATATRESDGWSWNTMRNTAVRNLNGYAHGAAGIGHGLLELYAATGDGRYRYAAEQAFLYERSFFDAQQSNWPDLRHTELGEFQYEGRLDQLRELLRSGGGLEAPPTRYMSAWCHGAPGIGLSRVRAWQLLGDPLYRDEVLAACANTAGTLGGHGLSNYSLCHGRGGNAETLMVAAHALGDESLRQPALESAYVGIDLHGGADGSPWPCGTMGAVSDPGLLLGEAGIGHFLLRLAHPQVPSVLILEAPDVSAARGGAAGEEGWRSEQERSVATAFSGTLAAFRAMGAALDLPLAPMGPAPRTSDVTAVYEALAARVRDEADSALRERLEDAFAVDRARYELARSVTDFTTEYLDGLARLPAGEVEWREGRVELSSRARVVSTRWDWAARAAADAAGPPADEDEDEAHWLIHFTGGRAVVRPLSPFAAVILESVREPATVDELIDTVNAAVSGGEGEVNREWLEDRVLQQLNQAYRAGFVNLARGRAGAAR